MRPLVPGDDHNLLSNRSKGDPHPQYGLRIAGIPGGSLPGGTVGQTLYFDGALWVAHSALLFEPVSGLFGIGTDAPSYMLHILAESAGPGNAFAVTNDIVAGGEPGYSFGFWVDISDNSVHVKSPVTTNSAFQVSGGRASFTGGTQTSSMAFKRTAVTTSPYSVTDYDCWLSVDTSAPRTINLQSAAYSDPYGGRFVFIKDKTGTANTNPITIVPSGAETIDNVAGNKSLDQPYGAFWLVADGTSNWEVL